MSAPGLRVAVVIHDESLSDHPELVDGVVAAAGLALENERLQAQLRARLEDLRLSRARVVGTSAPNGGGWSATSTTARSSGLWHSRCRSPSQSGASRGTRRPARCLSRRARISGARSLSCRGLARGIHPAVLTDRGLGPALDALAGRAHVRVDVREGCPASACRLGVEAAAYYLVAEALGNVANCARRARRRVRPRVRRGQPAARGGR